MVLGKLHVQLVNCEDNGYWKVYKFENAKLTPVGNKRQPDTSWKTAGIEDCSSSSCYLDFMELFTNLNFTASEILGGEVLFTPGDSSDMRISRSKSATGGADKTTSAYYPYLGSNKHSGKGLRLSIVNNDDANFGFSTKSSIGEGSLYDVYALATSGKLSIKFDIRGSSSSGKFYSPYELKGTEFYVSGYIIYK